MAVSEKGIDVRQTGAGWTLRTHLRDSAGANLTTGTVNLRLYRIEDGANPLSYDFNDNTFKSTALTTETAAMTHRLGNNGTTDTGVWTYDLNTLTGFTAGAVYLQRVDCATATPVTQYRELQYGSAEGDMTVTSARLDVDVKAINADTNADDRLAAALTTSNGIDLNMGQATPGSPTANTTGEGLRNAHDALPAGVAPAASGGLPTVDASNRIAGIAGTRYNTLDQLGTLRSINTTATGASTTSNIVLTAVSGTDADDDFNGQLIVIYDVSDSNRASVHRITDYTASSNTVAITPNCRFTPVNGDLVEIWGVVPASASGSADVNVTSIAGDANTPTRLNTALTVNAGVVGGLPVVKNAGLDLLNFTVDTGSTTTSIVVPTGSLPSGHANGDYSGILVIKDVSAGGRLNVSLVTGYTAATRALALASTLGFTPEVAVDTATLWVASTSNTDTLLTELLKVTTGFSAGNPSNLFSAVRALGDKTATTPTGWNTFSSATDSVEAIRDFLDLMAGAGFVTGTDSLEQIRNAIDDLLAPNVVTSTALSGSGFLSESVSCIRRVVDEPSLTPKYTDADLVGEIQSAFDEVIADLNVNTDHQIMVRGTIALVSGTQVYQLPLSCAELLRVAKINTTTNIPEWEVWPGTEHSFTGSGFALEGNTLRMLTDWKRAETLQILYAPNSEGYIHKGTTTTFSTTALTLAATPTDGTLDTRAQAYAGWYLHVLSAGGNREQTVIIGNHDSATNIVTPTTAFSPALAGTVTYEVLPQHTRLLKEVVCLYAARSILANEGNTKRLQTVTAKLQTKMRGMRLLLEKKNGRFLKSWNSDTIDNDMRSGWW